MIFLSPRKHLHSSQTYSFCLWYRDISISALGFDTVCKLGWYAGYIHVNSYGCGSYGFWKLSISLWKWQECIETMDLLSGGMLFERKLVTRFSFDHTMINMLRIKQDVTLTKNKQWLLMYEWLPAIFSAWFTLWSCDVAIVGDLFVDKDGRGPTIIKNTTWLPANILNF